MGTSDLRKFVAPEFVTGWGSRLLAGQFAASLGARRALLVTDPGVIAVGWPAEVERELRTAGLEVVTYDAVLPNPRDTQVMDGVEVFARERCDLIVAVGGGSPMDCAKGIGIVASNGGHIRDYEGVDKIGRPCPPLICVPTTSGSAADISQFAIVTHTDERYKMAIVSKALVPDLALVDPETTTTMARGLTGATGMDALVHAVEALASNARSSVTDIHGREAVRLVAQHLEGALEVPLSREHRVGMSMASLHAGLAFSNASLGAVHALAHALGGQLDFAHGECNALLLPHVVDFNFEAAPDAYRTVAESLGCVEPGAPLEKVRERLIRRIGELQRAADASTPLAERGVNESLLPRLAARALKDACIVTNPRVPTVEELEGILRGAY